MQNFVFLVLKEFSSGNVTVFFLGNLMSKWHPFEKKNNNNNNNNNEKKNTNKQKQNQKTKKQKKNKKTWAKFLHFRH